MYLKKEMERFGEVEVPRCSLDHFLNRALPFCEGQNGKASENWAVFLTSFLKLPFEECLGC